MSNGIETQKMGAGRKVLVGLTLIEMLYVIGYLAYIVYAFFAASVSQGTEQSLRLALTAVVFMVAAPGAIGAASVFGLIFSGIILGGKSKGCKVWGKIGLIFFGIFLVAEIIGALWLAISTM